VRKFHPENERTKHRYLAFLSDAKRLSAGTVEQVAAALADFEKSTGHKDFRLFRPEQAQSYKRRLSEATNPKTGKPLAKATVASRLASLKAFFQWLSLQPGCKSRLNYSDAEYFNPSASDARIAKATREKHVPSIEQVKHVLSVMPTETAVQRRDRTLLAFALLSGARDSAIASLSLRHVDLARRRVCQDPSQGVRTKNSKTIYSKFFPVGADIEAIVADWIQFLQSKFLWGPDDPLFPPSKCERTQKGRFRKCRLCPETLEIGGDDPRDFPEGFRKRRASVFQPACIPRHAGHTGRANLQRAGGIQGVEPELWA
jgi:site-specific recombinase XerD